MLIRLRFTFFPLPPFEAPGLLSFMCIIWLANDLIGNAANQILGDEVVCSLLMSDLKVSARDWLSMRCLIVFYWGDFFSLLGQQQSLLRPPCVSALQRGNLKPSFTKHNGTSMSPDTHRCTKDVHKAYTITWYFILVSLEKCSLWNQKFIYLNLQISSHAHTHESSLISTVPQLTTVL